MKYFYPAICSYDQKKGMFFVMFPDLIGCEAKASTMNEAAKKAREALAASGTGRESAPHSERNQRTAASSPRKRQADLYILGRYG